MKKLAGLSASVLAFLLNAPHAFALSIRDPGIGIRPTTSPSTVISNALVIAYVVAVIVVLFFVVLGAFKWITSGGSKDSIAEARKQIIAALVGLAILALALVIVIAVGKVLNINVLQDFIVPNLQGEATNI